MTSVSCKSCRENQNTHFVFNNYFFFKSYPLCDNVETYCSSGQATDGNMTHAHCMLCTSVYRHTLTICNIYCFSAAKLFARMRLIITLYVHCRSRLTLHLYLLRSFILFRVLIFFCSDYAVGWTTEESWFDSRQRQGIFVFSKASRTILESTQLPTR